MRSLLPSFAWGFVVVAAFAALGRLLARVARPGFQPDLPLAAGWGMAGMTFLGGCMNLAGLATGPALASLVIAAIVIESVLTVLRRPSHGRCEGQDPDGVAPLRGRWDWLWFGMVVSFAAAKYALSVGETFMVYDDLDGYLIHLVRMLETGSIGVNPFSGRQLETLNGQTLLYGFIASVCPLNCIHLMEPGICWILIAGQTWSILRRDLKASGVVSCIVTCLVLMFDAPNNNMGGNMTFTALYLTAVRTAYLGSAGRAGTSPGSLVLLAMTLAALCCLKTVFAPAAAMFVLGWYGLRFVRAPGVAVVRELALLTLLGAVFIAPWLVQQQLNGGTPLYPILGKGNHASGSGLIPEIMGGEPLKLRLLGIINISLRAQIVATFLALAILAFYPFRTDDDRRRVLLAALFGAVAGSFLVWNLVVADNRYTAPIMYAGCILAGSWGLAVAPSRLGGLALACCLALFLGGQWEQSKDVRFRLRFLLHPAPVWELGRRIRVVDNNPLERQENPDFTLAVESSVDEELPGRFRKAQEQIPAGARILIALEDGYVLDFARNPIWSIDNMGIVSPPPGMPITDDLAGLHDVFAQKTERLPKPCPSDRLRDYLRGVGVEYVMFQRSRFYVRPLVNWPLWNRVVRALEWLVHRELEGLVNVARVVSDDGNFVVVDLNGVPSELVAPRPAEPAAETSRALAREPRPAGRTRPDRSSRGEAPGPD